MLVSGGAWTSSNSTIAAVSAGVVTGGTAGTATISYSVTNSCGTAVATAAITVNPLPSAGTISGTTTVCSGSTTTLTDAVSGGAWTSSNSTIAAVSAGVVTGGTAGTATISYSVTNSCGTAVATAAITVNPLPSAGTISGTTTVCSGSTTTLTDAVSGGVWTSSNSTIAAVSAGVVTGGTAGTATISYSVTNSCGTAVATAVITVNPLPSAGTISGTTTVCSGSTTTLTDAVSGGVWTSSNSTIAAVSAGVVTGGTAGTATISYSVTNSCGTAVATAAITVNPLPSAGTISGTATVCSGSTTTFTDAVSGGAWTSSNSTIAAVSAGVVTGGTAGAATISYSVTNSCGTAVATKPVTVNPLPSAGTITGTTTVCPGSTTTLTDAVSGGVWTSSNSTIAAVSAGVVTGGTAGTASISYTVSNSCGTAVATAVITVSPLPSAGTISGTTTVCTGITTTLTDAVSGGAWTSSNTSVATVIAGVVTGVAPGTSIISYSVTNSCGTSVATAVVTVSPAPDAGAIICTTSICAGTTSILSNAVTGGTWSSCICTNAIATISSTGLVTGVSAGTATMSYTVTNSCGTAVATTIMTINPLPTVGAITGATTVCTGGTTVLGNSVSGGVWGSSNASIATATAGVVTGVTAGTAIISYTVTNGCGSITATVVVTVSPVTTAGTISGTSVFCAGSTTSLTSSVAGGSWTSSNTTVALVSSGIVTGLTAGTATISYTVTNTCGTATATNIVVINPLPNAGSITGTPIVCAGSFTVMTDSAPGGSWSTSNPAVALVSGGYVFGIAPGFATISYSVTNGCGTASATSFILTNPLPNAGTISGTPIVCSGSSTTLTDPIIGGAWSSSNTAVAVVSAGVVSGITPGTATISYSVTNSCGTAVASNVVNVNPLPNAGSITGTPVLCQGATTIFVDAAPGGVWTSSNSTVALVSGGTISGLTAGTATISYSVTNSCGTAVASDIVTIIPLPNAGSISGTPVVCVSAATTLTNSASGGTWSSSNSSIAAVTGGIVTGMSAGTATISYSVSNSCGTAVATSIVTVNPLPNAGTITGASTVCEAATTTLTDVVSGGVWSSSHSAVASVSATGVVSGIAAGNATISYSYTNSCGTAVATKAVTVNPLPNAGTITGASSVFVGGVITLSDAVSGGVWSSTNGKTSVSGGVVTGVAAGVDTIKYSVTNSCGTAIATKTIAVNVLQPITGPTSVMIGTTIPLADITPGGTWSSSNGAIASINASTGVVSGISTGTVTITYTVSGVYVTYVVNAYPLAPITGPDSVLIGATITLADVTPGGTWSSSNTSIATINPTTGVVIGTGTGTVTITYTVSGVSVIKTIQVKALAPITGPTSVMIGTTIPLADITPGGTWSSSNGAIASINASTGVVSGISTGTVTITYTVSGVYVTYVVNAYPLAPITGPDSVLIGATITLADVTPGGTWTSSNTSIATIDPTTGVVIGTGTGTVTITYTVSGVSVIKTIQVKALAPITGPTSVMIGTTIPLADITPGGTWSSSNGAIASINASTGVVSGISTGTVTITYTVSGVYVTYVVNAYPLAPITGPDSVLIGATITLADVTPGGTWSSSNTSIATINPTTGVVIGTGTGTVTITYTVSGVSVTYTVTVKALAPITGPTSVMIGTTIPLADITPGGTWSSSNGAIASINASTGVVSGISTGTVTITYTVSGVYVTYVVNAYPLAPITGPDSVLIGATITLADVTPGGTWSSSNASIATIDPTTGVVTGTGTGTVTITYTVSGVSVTYTVTVKALAPITGPTNVMIGTTIPLADITPGGTWSSSNGAIASINASTGVVSGISTGTVTITYTVSGVYVTYVVNAYPLAPITGPDSVLIGATITLADVTPGGTWSSSNTSIATIDPTTGVVTGTGTGVVTITYTVSGVSVTYTVTVKALAPITGPTSVMIGTTIPLADITPGGTWSSSDGAIASINASTGVVSGISTGTVTITYTVSGVYVTYVVNAYPLAPITGPDSVLIGATITLADVTPGGTWSSSNTSIATINPTTGVVIGTGTGTVTITYTVSGVSVIKTIQVKALAPITGPTSVMIGTTIPLADITPGGTWSSSNGAIASINASTGVVSGISTGTVTITYTVSGVYVTYVVNAYPLAPITGPDSVLIGATITLADVTPGGTWSSSNTSIATINPTTGVVIGTGTGTVTITYTVSGVSVTYTVTVKALAPITGPTSVMIGTTIPLADITPGGTWSSSNGAIASINASTGVVSGISTGTVTITYTVSGIYVTYVVNAYPLAPITGPDSVLIGATITLADVTPGGTWSSSNTSIATIDPTTGVVIGTGTGTVTITYTVSGVSVTYTVTVKALAPITGPTSVMIGTTIPLADITPGGTWSSSNGAIASINASTGVVSGISTGTVTITYTVSGVYVTYVVNAYPLAPITGPDSVLIGATITLADVTPGGTWTSSNTSIATIDPTTGVVIGTGTGTVTITYTVSGVSVTYTVTVKALAPITGPTSVMIGTTIPLADITPGGTWSSSNGAIASINASTGVVSGISTGTVTITYTVSGVYVTYVVNAYPLAPITGPDSVLIGATITLADVTPGGTWSSSNTSVATIDPTTGVVIGTGTGTVTITYTVSGVSVTYTVTVKALAPITGPTSVMIGTTIPLADITPGGTWSSSNGAIASINASTGVVSGISTGTVTITYTVSGIYVTYVVNAYPLAPITGPDSVLIGATITLADVTPGGTWSSSNTSIATIDPTTGVVIGTGTGTVTITYTVSGVSVTYTVTVKALAPITGPTSVMIGTTIPLADITPGGTWSSSNGAIASINASTGVVSGISTGTVTITYTVSGVYVTYVVNAYPLAPITGPDSVLIGATITLADVTPGGTWTSSNTSIATIDPTTGVVIGTGTGTVTITYTVSGVSVTYTVTVKALAPITGPTSVMIGTTIPLADITPGGTWSSSNGAIASINASTGVVSGISTGTVTITYTVSGVYVTYVVNAYPLAPITGPDSVLIGATITLADVTPGGTWSSSNTSVATIDPTTGVVIGTGTGTVTITYTVSGVSVTYTVTVKALAPITGPTSVMIGTTIPLADITPGGTWSSSNGAIASINASTGVVSGISTGTVTITYTVSGVYVTYVVNAYPLAPITGPDSVLIGATITLADVTPGGTWTSSNTSIATIDPTTGVVIGTGTGTVTITYTVSGVSVTYTVTVKALAPITGPTSVMIGTTIPLADITPGGTWSSSNGAIASIDASTGVVSGISTGTVTITYTVSGVYVTYVVNAYPLAPITGPDSVLIGATITLADVTPGGTWTSSNTSIATIDPTTGVVTGTGTGTVTITYTVSGVSVTYTVTVNPLLPITGPIHVFTGDTIPLADATPGGTWSSSNTSVASINSTTGVVFGTAPGTATITYTVGSVFVTYTVTVTDLAPITGPISVFTGGIITLADITPGGTWSSSNSAVASIDPVTGVVNGISAGSVTITYTVGAVYVTYTVTVTDLAPITGPIAVFTGGTITLADITPGGTWSSSNSAVASIDPVTGVVNGISSGTVTITYSIGGVYVTYTVTVNDLAPITGPIDVFTGGTITLADITPGGTWSSSNSAVASIDPVTGVVNGISSGSVTITYSIGGVYVTYTVTVNDLAPITGPTDVFIGAVITLADVTPAGTWSSSNSSIATIDPVTGVVTGVSTGSVTITYSIGGVYVTYTVAVTPLLPITGPTDVFIGASITLADATPGGTWSSSDGAIATIDPMTGDVFGVSTGTVTITYSIAGIYVTYTVGVTPLLPITGPMDVFTGATIPLADATPGGTWSSSNSSIAAIDPMTGIVTGAAPGTATITYTVGTVFVTYTVTVTDLAPITGPTDVFTGGTITLADNTPGGIWSSSDSWIASIDPVTGVINASWAGVATITYTVGSVYVTYTVNVHDLAPITGPTSVFVGATIPLADVTPGGTWSSSNSSIASIDPVTGVVSGIADGSVTITYSIAGVYVTYTVDVSTLAPITGPTNVLEGGSITLG